MNTSSQRNAQVPALVADQVQRITQQIKKNSPVPLTGTGAEIAITEIPPAGYYINQPGRYVLSNTIYWSPPADGLFFAAIVIQCDQVELDFQGNRLIAMNEGNHTSLGVIVLNPESACTNVTIKNGSIENMGLCGLWAVNTVGLSISGIIIHGLTYPSFEILPSAISLVMANSFNISNCQVKNVTTTAMLAGGFMVLGSGKGTISNCVVDTFTNTDGVASGFPYFECNNIITQQCSVNNLTTTYGGNPESVIGHTCIGFMPANCNTLTFTGCSATNINGCCDDCHGISLFPVQGATITNFVASHVHDGLGPQKTGAKATGIEVYGSDITVTNCQANDITAIVPQDLQATGFSACGTNIIFDSCTATGVTVYNADGQPDTSHGYGTGFGWAPDPRPQYVVPSKQVTYKDCTANNCQLGFDTWNHTYSNWINPVTSGPGLNHLIEPANTVRNYSMNFCSELPKSNPSSPAQTFPIYNQIDSNTYPPDWNS